MIDSHDSDARYCPILGHELTFSYCRKPGSDIPCKRIFDCWWEHFDITEYMKSHYSKEVLDKVTAPREPKQLSLAQIIKEAQSRVSGDKQS